MSLEASMTDLYSHIHLSLSLSLSLSLLFHLLLGDLQRQFVLGLCTIAKFFAKMAKMAKTAKTAKTTSTAALLLKPWAKLHNLLRE